MVIFEEIFFIGTLQCPAMVLQEQHFNICTKALQMLHFVYIEKSVCVFGKRMQILLKEQTHYYSNT